MQISVPVAPRTLRVAVSCAISAFVFALLGCGGSANQTSLNKSSYDFDKVAIGTSATTSSVAVTNPGSDIENVSLSLSGDPQFKLDAALSCSGSLLPQSSCVAVITYTPTQAGTNSANLTMTAGSTRQTLTLTGTGVAMTPGSAFVTATGNPQVAAYTLDAAASGAAHIAFSTDASYALTTADQEVTAGSPVRFLVAGMKAQTTYNMRAVLSASGASAANNADQTFTTGGFDPSILPQINVSSPGDPQNGIELMDATLGADPGYLEGFSTDLAGNIIWGYNFLDRQSNSIIQPLKLLPNGNFVATISVDSQLLLKGPLPTGTMVLIREFDLAGNTVRQITLDELNQRLAARGFNLTAADLHHDLAVLPNGHWIVIASVTRPFTNLPGNPGTTNVVGDALIDLDADLQPVWAWNEFDHLDVNRHPMNFPDWTHTNAVIYSQDDGDLLVSIRHQHWVVKVNYANGAGDGSIVWKLGAGGDFKLVGGTDPTDWFYAQHQPSFQSANTSGVFDLALMDNGDNRPLAGGVICGTSGAPACYTTLPLFRIDETAKTATIEFRQTLGTNEYSLWGGGSRRLANGDVEYDVCALPIGSASRVYEFDPDSGEKIWELNLMNENLYRAYRIGSMYPGVRWPQQ